MCAAEYINQAFNGQRGFQDGDNCATCGDEKAKKCCTVNYCNQVCQKYHRFVHKKHCQKQKGRLQLSNLKWSKKIKILFVLLSKDCPCFILSRNLKREPRL